MRLHRIRITKRKILLALGIWFAVVMISLVITAVQFHIINIMELKNTFLPWKAPLTGRTVVIFAPHCDDETLGTAGLIHEAVKNGATVWVVTVTNGDGFRAAVLLDNHTLREKPIQYVQFGYRRHIETIAALKQLGLPENHVITLGYPDQGLEPMWTANWSKPFRSIYTRDDHSPYINSLTPHAAYTGRQCLDDIKKVLISLKPDEIYMPHPNDQHPDHWATSAFVTTALYELGWQDEKDVAYYLVHRGDWPVPQGLHADRKLAPPAKLADMDTDWRQFHLDEDTVASKKQAIAAFKSQTAGTQRFIRSFVRQNELFGTRDPIMKFPEATNLRVDGKVDDWEDIDEIIEDPVDDGMPAHSRPAADLTDLYAAKDGDRLYFRISVLGHISKGTIYELDVRPLGEDNKNTTTIQLRPYAKPPSGWAAAYGKSDIELSCPADEWDGKPIIITASTRSEWYHITWRQIDRTAYKILTPQ